MERTVRAKADGMAPNGSHVRQGAKFTIDEGEFAPSWMEPAGWTPPEQPKFEAVFFDLSATNAARIAELSEQVEAEKARTAEALNRIAELNTDLCKAEERAEKAEAAIAVKDAEAADLKAALEEALKPKADPEPAAKAATKTK